MKIDMTNRKPVYEQEFGYDEQGILNFIRKSKDGHVVYLEEVTRIGEAGYNHTKYVEDDGTKEEWSRIVDGNITEYRNSSAYEYSEEFDKNGNSVHFRDNKGWTGEGFDIGDGYHIDHQWFDKSKDIINQTNSNDVKYPDWWCLYDHNRIAILVTDGYNVIEECDYDKNGNEIRSLNTAPNFETQTEYNDNNQIIRRRIDEVIFEYEYDAEGNCTSTSRNGVVTTRNEYDDRGRLVKTSNNNSEKTFEYFSDEEIKSYGDLSLVNADIVKSYTGTGIFFKTLVIDPVNKITIIYFESNIDNDRSTDNLTNLKSVEMLLNCNALPSILDNTYTKIAFTKDGSYGKTLSTYSNGKCVNIKKYYCGPVEE